MGTMPVLRHKDLSPEVADLRGVIGMAMQTNGLVQGLGVEADAVFGA